MLHDVLIPLRTHPVPDTREAVGRLLRLAARFATHVTLSPLDLVVPPMRPRWSSSFMGLAGAGAEIERVSREASTAQQAFTDDAQGLKLTARPLRASFGDPAAPVARAARYHDLTMVGFANGDLDVQLAEAAMFGTGRPALLVPPALVETDRPFARIAVAWDGSSAASRALFDAMPLLAKADDVVIITAKEDKPFDENDMASLTEYLSCHGLQPRFATADIEVLGIGMALQHQARAEGAGLLVMGAYGHSRMQQFILGGATSQVLDNLQLPVLMSHS